jgi:hypothetical protein
MGATDSLADLQISDLINLLLKVASASLQTLLHTLAYFCSLYVI